MPALAPPNRVAQCSRRERLPLKAVTEGGCERGAAAAIEFVVAALTRAVAAIRGGAEPESAAGEAI